MNILIVDNYDSFTYNIAHIVRNLTGVKLTIKKSDEVDISNLLIYKRIIFSPGPDLPRKGNIMEKILTQYSDKIPVLGICLGLQAIYLFYGGRLKKLEDVVHGLTKDIIKTDEQTRVLSPVREKFVAGLYHSWVADPDYLPENIVIAARSSEGRIMAIRHRDYDIEAVQFHPESIMTPAGKQMIESWIYG